MVDLHKKKNARGWTLIIAGIALPPVMGTALIFLPPVLFGVRLGGALVGGFISGAAVVGMMLLTLGRRDIAPRATELRRKDPRPPIVYLRPFANDGVVWKVSFLRSRRKHSLRDTFFPTYESRVARALKRLGPFVGVGDPRESRPPLGAARQYIRGADWQAVVTKLLEEAALVVLHAGESEGVLWEIEQIVAMVPPEKVILCLPLDKESEGPDAVRWATFRERTKGIFASGLPSETGRGEFLYFDSNWSPQVLAPHRGEMPPTSDSIRDRALQKLFDQFLHVSTPFVLRALGKSGLFFASIVLIVLSGALSFNSIIDTIQHGTFGIFPTSDEVIADYQSRYDKLRASLVRIASNLPPPGSASQSRSPLMLEPIPRFVAGEVSNTAFFMEEELLDPEAEPLISLGYFSDLTIALSWTSPDRRYVHGGQHRASGHLYETLDAGLATIYLVVHRILGLEGPEPITSENFDKRALIAEGFLIDLRTEHIIESWRLRAEPHTYKYEWNPKNPYKPYYVTANAVLATRLERLTGGSFYFR